MTEIRHLSLPMWTGGSLDIRFVYLVNNTTFRLTECPNKGSAAIPLYLGADLFCNTDIRTENHPRQHAKFAKKGLATKLHFSSVYRFHGLTVPTSNNSLWFYSVQGLFRIAFELFNKQDQLALLEHFQDVWKSRMNDKPLKMSYSLSKQLDFDEEPSGEATQTSTSTGENAEDNLHPETDTRIPPIRQKLHKLSDKLLQTQPDQLETVEMLLDLTESCIEGDLAEKKVTEVVKALLEIKQRPDEVYSSSLLCCVGRWLGRQFHNANVSVSQRVESFKTRHIDRISDLPAAEELSRELFPEAMRTLLLHWMGLSEEASVEKRRSEYPILLLILEFVNHNLITGVAHVLYSSLICK
ncbi:hypothetical protein WMY93_003976 [Mugilogobius chulae]|uniref:Uncharacterized protein n=1 Tax=Mugilogobius chulae TaxID=88201 RepID=A0AAW0Q2A7_9GOBI